MKRNIYLVVLAAIFTFGTQNIHAQTARTDWNGIDSTTVHQPLHASQYKTMYILPVDDSQTDYFEDNNDKTMQNVKNSRTASRPMIQKYIQKAFNRLVQPDSPGL